jgi:hypothetical protein
MEVKWARAIFSDYSAIAFISTLESFKASAALITSVVVIFHLSANY